MYGIIYKAAGPGGKVYIGQTVKTLAMRKGQHKYRSLKGDQRTLFQAALLDEGFSNFTWEQIDQAESPEELDAKEKDWIAHYDSTNPEKGYNAFEGGSSPAQTPESRRKNSEAHKGKHLSKETRRRMSEAGKGHVAWNKGKSTPEETRHKLSEAFKGEKNPNFGKRHSKETRQKISEALEGKPSPMKGKKLSPEHRRKISESRMGQIPWMKGRHHTEESRRKLSEARKKYLAEKKAKEAADG